MELTYIKTAAGKMYSALCANACTITTEDGVLIKEIEANKQDYFIAPNSKIASTDASLILTECFNSAPFGLAADWGEDNSEEEGNDVSTSDILEQVTGDIDELNTVTQALNERLSSEESTNSTQNQSLAQLESSVATLQSSDNEQSTLIANLQSSLTTTNSLPDWDNAVSLATSDFPYTAPANGWISGYATSLNDVSLIFKANGVAIALDTGSGDSAQMHILVSDGDIISATTSLSVSAIKFIPLKDA